MLINIGGGGGGIDTIKSAAFQYPRDRGRSDRDVWRSRNADFFYGYSNASTQFSKCESSDEKLLILGNRHQWWLEPSTNWSEFYSPSSFLLLRARILNATLVVVVPKLDQKSYWKDANVKKMNGLVTDLQMFALKSLQIPLPGRHPPSPCLSMPPP
ncbi:hypothetical protein Bca52824_033337 [Brassica carinata]|uniref:O-fucosyltransferase family protein n=1 Tax=Brassica carinata TaxID=52824 RepID=A0A8X7V9C1_BRACI|nr:hypothetical protein Bca52824_033337 [Brassica carinata]